MRNGPLRSVGVLVLLGLLTIASVQAQAPNVDLAVDKAAVEQTFRDYIEIFLTGDLKKVTAYYNEPTMFASSGAAVSRAEVLVIVAQLREDFRARGVAAQVLDRVEVKMLGEGVAFVSFIIKQQAKDGAIVNVRAGTYSLRKTDEGWKIAFISVYPPADFVKLD